MNSNHRCNSSSNYLRNPENFTRANHFAKVFGSFTDFERFRVSKVYSNFNAYLEVNIELLNLEIKQMLIDGEDTNILLKGLKADEETIIFKSTESFHSVGHIVQIQSENNWTCFGEIRKQKNNEFKIRTFEKIPFSVNKVAIFALENNSMCRTRSTLINVSRVSIEKSLLQIILGMKSVKKLKYMYRPSSYSVNPLFDLNTSQEKAVHMAMKYIASVIIGPPGTGKTETIAALVYHMVKSCQHPVLYNYSKQRIYSDYNSSDHILVTASTNIAVITIKERLIKKGISVLHVYARSKEEKYSNDINSLHYKLGKSLEKHQKTLNLNLNPKQLFYLRKQKSNRLLQKYKVICCTCNSSLSNMFNGVEFDHIVIDEATKALEAEIAAMLLRSPRHLVLIGDTNQLSNIIKNQNAEQLGLGVPMIQRFLDNKIPSQMLTEQYRMHPEIAIFSNATFYNGEIQNGVEAYERTHKLYQHPIHSLSPVFFYHVESVEEKKESSYINKGEAKTIENIIRRLYQSGVSSSEINIITFYQGQKAYMAKIFEETGKELGNRYQNFLHEVLVMSVDSSQGSESNFVIISCVRANKKCQIGFLDDYRRLNVAMTRAKYELIVVGNANKLKKNPLFGEMIRFFSDKQLVYCGKFGRLHKKKITKIQTKPFKIVNPNYYRD